MTPQELRESILHLAMQGKLVPQLPEDGSASVLLELINCERQHRIRAKTAKENKKVEPITEDDIPFDIPDSWEWIRFGDLVSYNMGKTPPRAESQWWGNDIPWVSIADMPENGHIIQTKERVSASAVSEKFAGKISKAGTLLMSFKLTVGKVSILDIDAVHNEAIISIYPYADHEKTIQNYLFLLLPYVSQYGESKNAIKGKTLNDTSISNLLIPLPPLAEQKRIVARIEELLPLIDRYEQAWSASEDFNARFPVDMQKSILQMAIQGKLVPQLPEEGTGDELFRQIQAEKQRLIKSGTIKKEKPLSEIAEDEIPFDIPDSWKWTKLGRLFVIERGSSPRPIQSYLTSSPDGVNWIKIGDSEVGAKYITSTSEKITTEGAKKSRLVSVGDLIISNSMSYGRPYIMAINGYVHDGWNIIHNIQIDECDVFDKDYLYYVLSSNLLKEQMKAKAAGGVVKNIKSDYLRDLIIPVPPLAEQKRIVAKLEEILPLCEQLK